MIKSAFKKGVIDYKMGFIGGSEAVNSSYASESSRALREDRNGKPMAIYRQNNSEIKNLKIEVNQELESLDTEKAE